MTKEVSCITTTTKFFRIERKAISFFKFILEAYDNLAVVETIDSQGGKIAVHMAPGCEDTVIRVIEFLGYDHLIEPVNDTDA